MSEDLLPLEFFIKEKEPMITNYTYLDFFSKTWQTRKVEVIKEREKTADVKMLEFGPGGCAPGTILKGVHKKNLECFKNPVVPAYQKPFGTYNYQ